jgi:peroxiredoxin
MTVTPSQMLPLGTRAPDFSLPDESPLTDEGTVTLKHHSDRPAVLVAFLCNHCPYVKHIVDTFAEKAKEYQDRGVGVVAISSNDPEEYPDDAPDQMADLAEGKGFTFPYCFDETQEVAQAYRAACTPDFFLFDGDLELFYRGQFDGSRPGNDEPVTGGDLTEAVDRVLAGEDRPEDQTPSQGCNIKWRSGNEPEYFA